MLDQREWDILHCIVKECIEKLDPPLKEAEMEFYEMNKEDYEEVKKHLAPGVTFMFVPANE